MMKFALKMRDFALKMDDFGAEAKLRRDESEAQRAELAYLKGTVDGKDKDIAALKRQLEANGLVANLG